MKKTFLSFFCLVFLCYGLLLPGAFASPALVELFEQNFVTLYERGKCGENILRLLQLAQAQEIDLGRARLIEITNPGLSVFGMLNVEQARNAGRRIANPSLPSGYEFLPGEQNWYHHFVLEDEGKIFDFDFTNAPTVLKVEDYFERMFLTERAENEGGRFFVGRQEKLKEYRLEVTSALEVLRAQGNLGHVRNKITLSLEEYLNGQD